MSEKCILIVDDSPFNRTMLKDIIGQGYNFLEANNGYDAISIISEYQNRIDLVLLDIVMPRMDGFEVLVKMNKAHWIDFIPVIMISSETSLSHVEHAYDLGAVDFITRPFESRTVLQRIKNTLSLYEKQKHLQGLIYEQVYDNEKNNQMMIEILSHIVEFRNGESGLHVLHIRIITEMLLKALIKHSPHYSFTPHQITLIVNASALHDIGKIGIDEKILNKPGKLTVAEFETMKKHALIGASMLENMSDKQKEELVQYAYDICRWHHERWDGRGYPDGLKEDEIPIWAQVVSIADVYDALTSERVYKKAYSHQKAIQMILNGECGSFNPLLIQCLLEIEDVLETELKTNSLGGMTSQEIERTTNSIINNSEYKVSDRTLNLLDCIQTKHDFYMNQSRNIIAEYEFDTQILTLSRWGAQLLGLNERIIDPLHNDKFLQVVDKNDIDSMRQQLSQMGQENAYVSLPISLTIHHYRQDYIFNGKLFFDEDYQHIHSLFGMIVQKQEVYRNNPLDSFDRMILEHPENDYLLCVVQLDKHNHIDFEKMGGSCHFGDQFINIDDHEFIMFRQYHDSFKEETDLLMSKLASHHFLKIGVAIFPRDGKSVYDLFMTAVFNMHRQNGKDE